MIPGIFENLAEKSENYEELFNALSKRSKDDLELSTCIKDVEVWLKECVSHGRFLTERSADRRDLQSLVSFWTSLLRQYGYEILGVGRLAPFDPNAGVPLEIKCPYPGLKAYDKKHQDDFIGREKNIEECLAHFNENHNRILMIVGGSGSGKSSLALAGILPALELAHSDWQFVPAFTPGAEPFKAMGRALAEALKNKTEATVITESLHHSPQQVMSELIARFGVDKPIMLLIDQFEELLTLCQNAQDQEAFSKLLYELVTLPESTCRILLTLRTDHLTRFETSPILSLRGLYGLVSNNQKLLAAIGLEGTRLAIAKPAQKVGLRFLPPDIIDRLASQSHSLLDGLPLLQFALQRLWEERPLAQLGKDESGNEIQGPAPRLDFINEELFNKLHNVQDALGIVAEELYGQFDEQKKELCERLMLELVLIDENFEQPLRRRRSKADLLKILVGRWPETAVNEVIDDFVEKKLLRTSGSNKNTYYEVAHEAMFRNWATFRDWISGEEAKTRLHAIKLIGREALDWRSHEDSVDYLKLAGEPLKAAQEYMREDWLVDKDTTDYVKACSELEIEKQAQQQEAEQAKELARQAEIARIQAEARAEKEKLEALIKIEKAEAEANESAQKAEIARIQAQTERVEAQRKIENTEAQRKIENAEANLKVQTQKGRFFRIIVALIIVSAVSVIGSFVIYINEQKSAALISSRLIMSKLQPADSLDVAYSIAKKGGADFRSTLTQSLENMQNRYVFSPRESSIVIAGQGTAIFQFDNNSDKTNQELKVFRVCENGKVDNQYAKITYGKKQLSQFVDIAPHNNSSGQNDSRLIILPFKRPAERGWDVEVTRLNWSNKPCAAESEVEKNTIKMERSLNKELDEVDEVSSVAFDASGENIVFSAVSYSTPQSSSLKSTVWGFNGKANSWIPVTPPTIDSAKQNAQPRGKNEQVVSAVAFTKEGWGIPLEEHLITGRLNGILYYGKKPLPVDDPSPVTQIFTSHSGSGSEEGDWFVYRHASEKLVAKRFNGNKPEEKIFASSEKGKGISSVSINFISVGADKKTKPLVIYVEDKHPKCWIKEKQWQPFDCSSTHIVDQAVISADEKHLILIEPSSDIYTAAVHSIYQEFQIPEQWVGRVSRSQLIQWPVAKGKQSDKSKTSWSKKLANGFNRYTAQLSPGAQILNAAISPDENYIAWFEGKNVATNFNFNVDLRIYNIKEDRDIEFKADKTLQKLLSIERPDLAVRDNGEIVFAINNELWKLGQTDKSAKKVPFPAYQAEKNKNELNNQDPNIISCLELSPDSKNLVIGTSGGRLLLLNLTDFSLVKSLKFEDLSRVSMNVVTACAVDETGLMVAGFSDGNVRAIKADAAFTLSPMATNRINTSVKTVKINSKKGLVAALFDRQVSGCSANGLAGQSIRVWGDLGQKEASPQISSTCVPNRPIMTIGSMTENNGKLVLPVFYNEKEDELMPCLGCANQNEKPADVLNRLLKDAKDKGAQDISADILEKRYGIKY
ncbi:hypothetical protein CRENPOLYSF2_2440012 [Crenothrix polyspora]|uniref:Novel STAND NTPase 1 domain-containing protein n=1 Tax=Crenothrix polyspora TaxID=360316 RepID=A0A1R4H711_9GAMM|nr:hypothetical protein [Crenothrix polyspora]SJM91947.1 hypothetical protein CRENPOLYSF2_2440012 [Crenothrix polyspora]